jgi:D-arginine utilization repressor
MKQFLKNAIPFAEAFSRLLYPLAEIVIHNLETDKIEAIYNPISKRKIGDNSFLDRVAFDEDQTVIGPYHKTNWDGRPLKSMTIVLRDTDGKAKGCLCINLDISIFSQIESVMSSFCNADISIPKSSEKLFKEDFYEKINLYVQKFCTNKQVKLEHLHRTEKQKLIRDLSKDGAFNGKKAADYIGRILGISRATVYNYLNEVVNK